MISNFLALWHTLSGGIECAWEGKVPGFESDRTCFFFKREKKTVFKENCRLSCHIVELLFFSFSKIIVVTSVLIYLCCLQFFY